MLFDFLWNGKKAVRVNRNVLLLGYESGGLQLYDMIERMKIMRVKWLRVLLSLNQNDKRRLVVDKLIGSFRNIKGLKIVHHDIGNTKLPFKSLFYEKAISIWKSMKIEVKCVKKEKAMKEIVYKNVLFTKPNGTLFKFPNLSNKKLYIPQYFKDLPVTINSTKIDPNHRQIIKELNQCFWRFPPGEPSNTQGMLYQLPIDEEKIDILDLDFKKIYSTQISKRIVEKKWIDKWQRMVGVNNEDWSQIWRSIHNSIHGFRIQSCIWEILHLNFFCSYKARQMYGDEGRCNLCNQVEQDSFHIILRCPVLKEAVKYFEPLLKKCRSEEVTEKEICFGLYEKNNSKATNLRNFISFHIKAITFRSRNIRFSSIEVAKKAVTDKVTKNLKKEVSNKLNISIKNRKVEDFKNRYLYKNILGTIRENSVIFNL